MVHPPLRAGARLPGYGQVTSGLQWAEIPDGLVLQTQKCRVYQEMVILVPAVGSFTRVWERLVAVVLSLYVLAAFVLVGLLLGGAFLWYFDEL